MGYAGLGIGGGGERLERKHRRGGGAGGGGRRSERRFGNTFGEVGTTTACTGEALLLGNCLRCTQGILALYGKKWKSHVVGQHTHVFGLVALYVGAEGGWQRGL